MTILSGSIVPTWNTVTASSTLMRLPRSMLGDGNFDNLKYRQSQQGVGVETICRDCSSCLGVNYVSPFSGLFDEVRRSAASALKVRRFRRWRSSSRSYRISASQPGGHARLQELPTRQGKHRFPRTLPAAHGHRRWVGNVQDTNGVNDLSVQRWQRLLSCRYGIPAVHVRPIRPR